MARTRFEIEEDIDALKSVMGSGALAVSFADRRIQYQTYADQQKALTRLERELQQVTASRTPVRRYYGFYQAR